MINIATHIPPISVNIYMEDKLRFIKKECNSHDLHGVNIKPTAIVKCQIKVKVRVIVFKCHFQ